jgi:chromosome segregation ATPase
MNSIFGSNVPVMAYVLNDLQITQDSFEEVETESFNLNEEPPSKRRKITSSGPLASLEPTISRMGIETLIQQNPTEHLSLTLDRPSLPNSSNESAKNPETTQKSFSKLSDEERKEMLEAKKSYKDLLKKGCYNPKQKFDFKLLICKYDKHIAKNDHLVVQEELKAYKAQSELELNQTRRQLDEANNKGHATEELYNKKINFLNATYEQKNQILLDQIKTLESASKIAPEQNDKINKLESEISKKNEKLKALTSKLAAFRKKIHQHDEAMLEKTKEMKLLIRSNAEEDRNIEKDKRTIGAQEKVIKTFEYELTKLKEELKYRQNENKQLQLKNSKLADQGVDLVRKHQSVQEELEGQKKETSSLKRNVDELTDKRKQSIEKLKTFVDKFTLEMEDLTSSINL